MTKNNILFSLIIFFFVIISSCNTSKNSIQIRLNDIDSAIRIVIPSHNCGCNWEDKKSDLRIPTTFKKFGYAWSTIFIKNIDSIDVNKDSKKVWEQLVKLDSRYINFKRFFFEYRIWNNNDSSNNKVLGTWFHFEDYCDGYVLGISALELQKNTSNILDRKKLCK